MPAADSRDTARLLEVSFFVPCLNEEDNIGPTLETLVEVARDLDLSFEILVFDDASTDDTAARVRAFQQRTPDAAVRLFENERTMGLGFNYVEGAFQGRGTFYMLVNGDHAESRQALETILERRGEADMIVPYFDERDVRGVRRRAISRAFTWIVNRVGGFRLHYYNGPVLHRRELVTRWHPDSQGYAYQAELVTTLLRLGKTVREVQIANQDRESGVSKAFTVQNVLSVGHSLLQIALRRLRAWLFHR
ncbi:MAG: glycosyltransferase [Thermoanaerobaculia bacterium]|nr:glycosyltransferase [Thermoanaerobaculia bacterium]